MDKFTTGTVLIVDDVELLVIGSVTYRPKEPPHHEWIEYRLLSTEKKEYWLSIDEYNEEYSVSWPTELHNGQVDHKWHKVDEGIEIVVETKGDVDAYLGEEAEYIEYEDITEEEILSVEIWRCGTEVSKGYYLDSDEIIKNGYKGIRSREKFYNKEGITLRTIAQYFLAFLITMLFFDPYLLYSVIDLGDETYEVLSSISTTVEANAVRSANDHFKNSNDYKYLTSISGNQNQKADVYQALISDQSPKIEKLQALEKNLKEANQLTAKQANIKTDVVIDYLVKDLIITLNATGNELLKPEVVTANKDENGLTVGLLTGREYCLFYHPEDESNKVYVQVSRREFNYSTDVKPYHASRSTHNWYLAHYFSTAFQSDAVRLSSVPSAYNLYNGPIVKDLGNGYYDVYSSDIRQSSIMNRDSSSGGINKGK